VGQQEVKVKRKSIRMNVKFAVPPNAGLSLVYDGQVYVLLLAQRHEAKTGDSTTVLAWQSMCRQCTKPFTFTTGMAVNYLTRNCVDHRRFRDRVRPGS
jgi:hypothetical protein